MPQPLPIRKWQQHFQAVGLPEDLVRAYMWYVRRMYRRGLPVIFDFRHLAALLGRTTRYLASAVNSSHHHYRTFSIPKRRGGERSISAPYPALLDCQQWITHNILSHVSPHPTARGFRAHESIKSNAEPHLGAACLLKMDLRDFFPSITLRRVVSVYRTIGYPKNIAAYLGRLSCLDGRLPQGGATSPALSNLVAFHLDRRLAGLADSFNLTYTRYADDMTFSGDRISVRFPRIINSIVEEEGYTVNAEKTRLCRGSGRRVVTGLVVSGTQLKVTRDYKRQLRQELHYIFSEGLMAHMAARNITEPFYIDSLIGRISHWLWVEPENDYAKAALARINDLRGRMGF